SVRGEPERRGRRYRIRVPPPRRTRGLRPAAGPAGRDEGPAEDVRQRRDRGAGYGRRRRTRVPREPPFMSTSEYDSYRPPEPEGGRRKRRRGGRGGPGGPEGRRGGPGGRRGGGWKNRGADGNREMPMVEDVEFTSYYGRPIVKAPPCG